MPGAGLGDGVVVVGASLAGLRAAEALRVRGYDGRITVVGAEPHMPYDRPPLSKQVLTGKVDADGTALGVADDLRADWVLGDPAAGLDLEDRTVRLESGADIGFGGLLIATGARPRVLPWAPPGPGVHYLRTIDDALALRDDLRVSRAAVVIGAGFIGLEVACSAATLGVPVTVLEALPVPLERSLGAEMGTALTGWHRSKGMDLRVGVSVQGLERDASGRPSGVRLADGAVVDADTVVVGIGVEPATGWLVGSGVDLADWVLCDRYLQVLAGGSPVPGVAAAGDVARWWHDLYGEAVRIEHWTNAVEAGEAAAATLLGEEAPYAPVPYFWSDQHGVKLQFVGRSAPGDEIAILEGDLADDRVLWGYGREGKLVGALGIRRPARVMALQRLIGEGAAFPPGG